MNNRSGSGKGGGHDAPDEPVAGLRRLARLAARRMAWALALLCLPGAAAAETIAGRWIGTAFINNDQARLELEIEQTGPELRAHLFLPELIWASRPSARPTARGAEVEFPFGIGPVELRLLGDGELLANAGSARAITLRRARAARHEVVDLAIPVSNGQVAGRLYLPPGERRLPAVLLAGGATTPRADDDGMRAWCLHLVRRNLACLATNRRPDGEQSAGRSDLDRDADDLRAALNVLRGHASVDPERVGLAAFSRGAWTAMRLAASQPSLAFLFMTSPPALSPGESERHAVRARMLAAQRPEADVRAAEAYYDLYLAVAAGSRPWAELDRAARNAEQQPWGRFVDQPLREDQLGFWRRNGRFTNEGDFAKIRVPVFAVWGSADAIVPTDIHAPVLRASLSSARLTSLVVAGGSHTIELDAGPDRLGRWRWPTRAPGFVLALDHWLADQVAR